MKLYDTLSRTTKPIKKQPGEEITLYTCGPTVYDHTHIGHMRKYVMDDILKRTLMYLGYKVKHVMNITDVGHLTGDDDAGEDKIEKKATTLEDINKITSRYTDEFIEVMKILNVILPEFSDNNKFPESGLLIKATDSIKDMITIIKKLEANGYTYQTEQAVYFDVTKFKDYGKLSGQKLEEKKQAVREEVNVDPGKKHPADFALWFKLTGRFANHLQHWPSPWGEGFPGWHIECSAMSMTHLGETIDIHTGGIDHIPVHHENEIAQSEGATGKKFVKHWVHHAFLQVEGEKMSKSKSNFYTLEDIKNHKIDPVALRYLFLQTHYRKPMNFTWEAVEGAQEALQKLRNIMVNLKTESKEHISSVQTQGKMKSFIDAISDDLQTSNALGWLWTTLQDKQLPSNKKLSILLETDQVLGLNLQHYQPETIPEQITHIAIQREQARKEKDFHKSDELRRLIEEKGYSIEDTPEGYKIKKI